MSEAIITVEGLGKRYRLGAVNSGERYTALRDVLTDKAKSIFRRNSGNGLSNLRVSVSQDSSVSKEDFWALKDVSFEVKQGEVVGIIGRNGAGKSTLLKILSRITDPTEGKVRIRGRVASLLEVGTGFHPELTGRENIYLNGAILGMTRTEIKSKFDEIVAFAEVERFLDTPVKRYSSGMYVRLAFAVAAHLDPEILVVDEVLAVGDAEFQKKCLGKMGEVAQGGRTVLFVSHDLGNVTTLCRKALLLEEGRVTRIGDVGEVVAYYLRNRQEMPGFASLTDAKQRSGSGEATFESIELLKGDHRQQTFAINEPLTMSLTIHVSKPLGNAPLAIGIKTQTGVTVHDLYNWNEHMQWIGEPGKHKFTVTIPEVKLHPGGYVVNLWIGDQTLNRVDYVQDAIAFDVVQLPTSGVPWRLTRSKALVLQKAQWLHEREREEKKL